MSKRKKTLSAIALVAGVTLIGGTLLAGSVSASEDAQQPFHERVAEAMGYSNEEATQFQETAQEVRKEMRSDKLDEKLAEAVEDGQLTTEQADAIREKRNAMQNLSDEERTELQEEMRDQHLDLLVEKELISEETAEELKEVEQGSFGPKVGSRQGHRMGGPGRGMGMFGSVE